MDYEERSIRTGGRLGVEEDCASVEGDSRSMSTPVYENEFIKLVKPVKQGETREKTKADLWYKTDEEMMVLERSTVVRAER